MNQQLTQRPEPLAFRVIISTSRGLNIILSNRRIENERTYSHFVTPEQAEQFAADLEAALSSEYYRHDDHRRFACQAAYDEGVYAVYNDDIFRAVYSTNLLMPVCDLLITKPSELACFPIPKIFMRHIGGHEVYGAIAEGSRGIP